MTEVNPYDPYEEVSLGTTLVAIKYNGGVLMGSDTLTTSGSIISDRSANKCYELSPSPSKFGSIRLMKCGNAAHSQILARTIFNYLNYFSMELAENEKIALETVSTLLKNICYQNKNFIGSAFILSNGTEIHSITPGGAFFKHDLFAVMGSGGTYINGYLQNHIKPNMSYYEGREALIKAVGLAIHVDSSSGGNIRLVDVKLNGESTEEIIDHHEIKNIIA
jgi:20S proteasome subunit beta 1